MQGPRRPFRSVGPLVAMVALAGIGQLAGAQQEAAQPVFGWPAQARVLFFGDSITEAAGYVNGVDAFLATRFPETPFSIINHGIHSQTISGLSEPDQSPVRPNALDRFERDVANWEPDVLVSCFGMNDGIYAPISEETLQAFQTGLERLIERTSKADVPRLVLLTPPPFDPYRRHAADPSARSFGYKFPYLEYDSTLDALGRLVLAAGDSPSRRAIDLHTAINRHLDQRRQTNVSFHVAPDAVHPNATGHMLMAASLLRGLGEVPPLATAEIDVASQRVVSGWVRFDNKGDAVAKLAWSTGLPWPMPADVDAESLEVETIGRTFNALHLTLTGLEDGTYEARGREVEAADRVLGTFEVVGGKGKAVLAFPDAQPLFQKESIAYSERLAQRNRARYDQWRRAIETPDFSDDLVLPPDDAAVTRQLYGMAQPRAWQLSIYRRP